MTPIVSESDMIGVISVLFWFQFWNRLRQAQGPPSPKLLTVKIFYLNERSVITRKSLHFISINLNLSNLFFMNMNLI